MSFCTKLRFHLVKSSPKGQNIVDGEENYPRFAAISIRMGSRHLRNPDLPCLIPQELLGHWLRPFTSTMVTVGRSTTSRLRGERCFLARVLPGCIETLESFLIMMLRIIFHQLSVHHWSWTSLVLVIIGLGHHCVPPMAGEG